MKTPQLKAVERFENSIMELTAKCPKAWREDIRQELRLIILQLHRITQNDDIKEYFALQQFKDKIKSFTKLERNKGMRYAPDKFDLIEYVNNLRYQISLDGSKLIIHNKL